MKEIIAKKKLEIEVKLTDINGNEEILKSAYITTKDHSRVSEIGDDPNINIFNKLCMILTIYFGGTKEQYEKYDLDTLNAVMEYYNQEYNKVNPLKAQKK